VYKVAAIKSQSGQGAAVAVALAAPLDTFGGKWQAASGKCVEYNQNRNNRHNCNRIVVNYCLCLRFVSVVVIAPDWIKLACVYVWARCVCVCVCAPKRARQIRCLAVEEVQAGV